LRSFALSFAQFGPRIGPRVSAAPLAIVGCPGGSSGRSGGSSTATHAAIGESASAEPRGRDDFYSSQASARGRRRLRSLCRAGRRPTLLAPAKPRMARVRPINRSKVASIPHLGQLGSQACPDQEAGTRSLFSGLKQSWTNTGTRRTPVAAGVYLCRAWGAARTLSRADLNICSSLSDTDAARAQGDLKERFPWSHRESRLKTRRRPKTRPPAPGNQRIPGLSVSGPSP